MLDLLALAKPLEPVKLPNGRVLAARPLDAAGWELLRKIESTGDASQGVELLRRVLPDVTDDDLATLGIEDVPNILFYCARKIQAGFDAVGNSPGTAAANTSPPSSPSPTPSTL